MLKNEQFDVGIVGAFNKKEVDFTFEIEHVIGVDAAASLTDIKKLRLKTYKVVSYLYGRLQIDNRSYFAEIFGYIDTENPTHLTYHFAHIDKSFTKNYTINYSDSDFCEEDYFALS